ncbi:MAG TPA: PVC-type heme-binding CxxCH protein, partial [Pirellulaceae bacterium]|nr:PVC-type heme-binding CxxCH protein [Pirellulaceae bacterium]
MIDTLRNGWWLVLVTGLMVNASQAQMVVATEGPLTPEAALKAFQCQANMRVELVAAEPLVVSPVAMAFDERGRLFVAENRGYPSGPAAGEEPIGRIALLTDTNGDGQMDARSEFATGLTFPNGVLPWRDGVIVTCAPDVLFLRDTNDDGVADERQVLFTGFSTGGSTQLRVSHPTLSLDNWIYVTSGLTGGKIVAPDNAQQPAVEIKRTDFRFRPDSLVGEAADGGAQFGISFDDFGRRFICYNRVQVQHVVLPARVLARHPQLAFSETVQNCPVETVAEPLKGHGQAARLFPISANVTTADSHAGTFTAACAVTVFRGTGLPAAYQGGVFSCDPTGNLVHFDLLEPRGATFGARPAQAGVEFLASSDSWCRPVFLSSGPDGALYVCDMYRRTIEHPDYLPVEIRKHTDFEGGKTMGRIWRVVRSDLPQGNGKQREVNYAKATTAELVATLGSPDGWRRDTAQRLLTQKRDAAALAPLRKLLGQAETSPATYVHALNLLATLDQVADESLRAALSHPAPPVREQALLLVEPRLASDAKWLDSILPLAKDANPRVRFQLAIALGALSNASDERITTALASIAAQGSDDRWLRAAVFSSLLGRELSFLSKLTASEADEKANRSLELWKELGRLIGASQPRAAWSDVVR